PGRAGLLSGSAGEEVRAAVDAGAGDERADRRGPADRALRGTPGFVLGGLPQHARRGGAALSAHLLAAHAEGVTGPGEPALTPASRRSVARLTGSMSPALGVSRTTGTAARRGSVRRWRKASSPRWPWPMWWWRSMRLPSSRRESLAWIRRICS